MGDIHEEDNEEDAFDMFKKKELNPVGKNSTIELRKVHGNSLFENKRQVKDNRFGKSNKTMKSLRQLGATS